LPLWAEDVVYESSSADGFCMTDSPNWYQTDFDASPRLRASRYRMSRAGSVAFRTRRQGGPLTLRPTLLVTLPPFPSRRPEPTVFFQEFTPAFSEQIAAVGERSEAITSPRPLDNYQSLQSTTRSGPARPPKTFLRPASTRNTINKIPVTRPRAKPATGTCGDSAR